MSEQGKKRAHSPQWAAFANHSWYAGVSFRTFPIDRAGDLLKNCRDQ
jgi:hypothetical protein